MQKIRYHNWKTGGFSPFNSLRGSLSTFPHGTSSLSNAPLCDAKGVVPLCSDETPYDNSFKGAFTPGGSPFQTIVPTPCSLATTCGSAVLGSPSTKMFQFLGSCICFIGSQLGGFAPAPNVRPASHPPKLGYLGTTGWG